MKMNVTIPTGNMEEEYQELVSLFQEWISAESNSRAPDLDDDDIEHFCSKRAHCEVMIVDHMNVIISHQ